VAPRPAEEKSFYRRLASSCSWDELLGVPFAVSVRKIKGFPRTSSLELAASVADGIADVIRGRCIIDLKRPKALVRLITSPEVSVLGLQLLATRGDRHRIRSKSYKPFKHGAAITPEEGGVLVNLTGWRSPLLDPFCGSGTIVIEACLRGLEAVGLDINPRIARGAHLNIRSFSCDARGHVVVGDATLLPFRHGAFGSIATNPPYDRLLHSTRPSRELVHSLLLEGGYALSSGAVIAVVHPATYTIAAQGFRLEEFPLRVHGGLTRLFARIQRKEDEGGS